MHWLHTLSVTHVPSTMKIWQCFLELPLKLLGMFLRDTVNKSLKTSVCRARLLLRRPLKLLTDWASITYQTDCSMYWWPAVTKVQPYITTTTLLRQLQSVSCGWGCFQPSGTKRDQEVDENRWTLCPLPHYYQPVLHTLPEIHLLPYQLQCSNSSCGHVCHRYEVTASFP